MNENGVTCTIDVNDFDQDVVDLAAKFAKLFEVHLDLLHVTLFPDPSNAEWPGYLGSPNTIIQDNHRLRAVTTNEPGVAIRHHHLSGLPAETILEFVERYQSRLLVMGTHGRHGFARILGSVAAVVLRRAPCPVMVLRQRQNSQQFADLRT